MGDRRLVILDPMSSGVGYSKAARKVGLTPMTIRTFTPPAGAPMHGFLPEDPPDLLCPVDHAAILFGDHVALTTVAQALIEQLPGPSISGVVAGSEIAVPLADAVAAELGLPGNALADAICDRLVHNAHRLKLGGDSIRRAEGLTGGKKPAK